MEKEKWVVYHDIVKEFHAGNKYERDILGIFQKCGFNIMKYGKLKENKAKKVLLLLKFLRDIFVSIPKGSIVFFLAPLHYPYDMVFRFMVKIKRMEVYAFIIDINGLRGSGKLEREITDFMLAKGIIAQNDNQKIFLRQKGYTGRIQVMGILDFLDEPDKNLQKEQDIGLVTICYGGNLSMKQSGFLYKWTDCIETTNLKVLIYGINLERKIDNNVFQYMGSFPPDQVTKKLTGSFGLVWNGTEIDTCGGVCGEYYKYASPHKLSMYIMAGMPVIVWKYSAMGGFVDEKGIGFSVTTLNEIEEKIDSLDLSVYEEMKLNVYELRQNISKGYYAETCIKEILR
ncbi:MAG: hypothetical protein NC489_32125 [Ruminococcus flavefaciens]|nr:hypothetical protein [Ruminococcus flavefaciens]